MLTYTSEFTKEQIIEIAKELNCEIIAIDDLISVKMKKLDNKE